MKNRLAITTASVIVLATAIICITCISGMQLIFREATREPEDGCTTVVTQEAIFVKATTTCCEGGHCSVKVSL